MPRVQSKTTRKLPTQSLPHPGGSRWRRITQAAFFLSLTLVACRMMMQEVLRPEALPTPGSKPEVVFPGPSTGLVLDLLSCLPALLVLTRRLIDQTFTLRLAWSHLIILLLGMWTGASVLWATDKFAAAVQSCHWCCALVLLWSTSQLVREWLRLRVLTALCFGLLLMLLAQGYYYRFVDLPDLQKDWRAHKDELLKDRGLLPDSREATQMGKNIESGEVSGFSVSRNTYAAVLVLLMIVSAGIAIQRMSESDSRGSVVPILVGLAVGLVMLYRFVGSKTAFVTPLIAAMLLWVIWSRRDWLARRARGLYWGGVVLFGVVTAATVGHGLKHGTLLHVSLTFRWQYWVGAARVFAAHPLRGVGWGNFGPFYLAARLPQAAEEPSDPHNFIVRAFVELGLVGGFLMVAWMLRLWWELTRNQPDPAPTTEVTTDSTTTRYRAMPFFVWLSVAAVALNSAVSIDWSISQAWVVLELFKRAMFVVALAAGLMIAGTRSWEEQDLDDRPAPWILYALLVALGLFLLHNLIDFSMFEPGPMFLFALLTGGALGIRMRDRKLRNDARTGTLIAFGISGIAWLLAWGAGVVPVASAEMVAQQGDAHIRAGDPERASRELLEAFRRVPINADYAYRAEQASLIARSNPLTSLQLIDAAVAADPITPRYRRARAELEVATGDLAAAWADYDRALQIDPNDMSLRLEYASALRDRGNGAEARKQYELTLRQNSRLAPDEIKRLPPSLVEQITRWIESLPAPQSPTGGPRGSAP